MSLPAQKAAVLHQRQLQRRDTPRAFIPDSADAAASTTCVPGNSLNCVLLVGRKSGCSFVGRGGKRLRLSKAREHYSERQDAANEVSKSGISITKSPKLWTLFLDFFPTDL